MNKRMVKDKYVAPTSAIVYLLPESAILGSSQVVSLSVEVDDLYNMNGLGSGDFEDFDFEF